MSIVYIDIHTHRDVLQSGLISVRSYRFGVEEIPYGKSNISAAIHPWDVALVGEEIGKLESAVSSFRLISEIGLDKLHDNFDLQKELFIAQLDIAKRAGKGVVIHAVRAHNEILSILSKYSEIPRIIHSFVGSKEIAREYLGLGCYLSFSPISFGSKKSISVLEAMPLDRLFFESDDSGVDIKEIYRRGGEMLGVESEELQNELLNNYNRVCLICAQSC